MTDHLDNQTTSLNEKPKRGRPATGTAMTAAEKQKAYRLRMKEKKENTEHLKGMKERIIESYIEETKKLKKEIEELKTSNVTEIKFVIRTRSKGKRKWDEKEKEILWDSMEEAIETVKILQKENEKREWEFEYKIEPASDFMEKFIRVFK